MMALMYGVAKGDDSAGGVPDAGTDVIKNDLEFIDSDVNDVQEVKGGRTPSNVYYLNLLEIDYSEKGKNWFECEDKEDEQSPIDIDQTTVVDNDLIQFTIDY